MTKATKILLTIIICVFQILIAALYYKGQIVPLTILLVFTPLTGYISYKYNFYAAVFLFVIANALAALL